MHSCGWRHESCEELHVGSFNLHSWVILPTKASPAGRFLNESHEYIRSTKYLPSKVIFPKTPSFSRSWYASDHQAHLGVKITRNSDWSRWRKNGESHASKQKNIVEGTNRMKERINLRKENKPSYIHSMYVFKYVPRYIRRFSYFQVYVLMFFK